MKSTRKINPRNPWRKAATLAAIPLCAAALTACAGQGNSSAASNTSPTNDASNVQASNTADSAAATAAPTPTPSKGSDATASSGGGDNANASDAAKTSGNEAQGASAGGNESDLESGLQEAVMSGISVGETFTAAGQQMTACTIGDGYALNIVAAGSNTSCEFAREVMRIQTQDLDPTNDNIRDHLSPNIKSKSPATGKA